MDATMPNTADTPTPGTAPPRPMGRALLLYAGHLCIALGLVGAFLPLMPTTPFLLLAAFCYAKASPRHYAWLTGHRVFGPLLRDYLEERGVTRRTKAIGLSVMWLSLGLSAWRFAERPVVAAVLALTGVALTVVLLRLRTLPDAA